MSDSDGISGAGLAGLVAKFGWRTDGEGDGWIRVAPGWGWDFVVIPLDPAAPDYIPKLARAKERVEQLGGAILR